MNPVRFGPWPKGMNTAQPDTEIGQDEARLAVNVDFTREGRARRRRGSAQVYAGTDVHSVGPSLLFAEGAALKRYDAAADSASTLRTGLTPGARIVYQPVNDDVFWTNSITSGRVDADFANHPWGLPVPNAPTLTAASGGLLAEGAYQVVLSYSRADGEESGTGLAVSVDVPIDNGAIAITAIPQPASGLGITTINIHVSAPGGHVLYWHGSVDVGTTAYAITTMASTKREARNRFLTAPPAGHLLTYRHGRIYIADGNILHYTEPLAYGLYDPAKNFFAFDSEIRVAKGVTNGMWVVTARRTYWLPGDNPNEAQLNPQADYSAPMQMALDIPESNDVAWLSHRGWVRGTAEGQLINLAEQRVQTNLTEAFAPTLFREANGIRQFVALARGSADRVINSDDFADAMDFPAPAAGPDVLLFEAGERHQFENGGLLIQEEA